MFPTPTMYAINESPVGDLPLHFIPFPVRPISSSEMASEQKSRREGFGGSCALRPLVSRAFLFVIGCYIIHSETVLYIVVADSWLCALVRVTCVFCKIIG